MPWFKKKQKNVNDYYKNELLRSRMSDISIRTDEIIQQYFFASKEDTLTLDEYLKIRELATMELGLKKSNEENPPISQAENTHAEFPIVKEKSQPQKTVHNIINAAPEPQIEPEAKELSKAMELPFEDKTLSESLSEPQSEQKESSFDFLAMLQSVED